MMKSSVAKKIVDRAELTGFVSESGTSLQERALILCALLLRREVFCRQDKSNRGVWLEACSAKCDRPKNMLDKIFGTHEVFLMLPFVRRFETQNGKDGYGCYFDELEFFAKHGRFDEKDKTRLAKAREKKEAKIIAEYNKERNAFDRGVAFERKRLGIE